MALDATRQARRRAAVAAVLLECFACGARTGFLGVGPAGDGMAPDATTAGADATTRLDAGPADAPRDTGGSEGPPSLFQDAGADSRTAREPDAGPVDAPSVADAQSFADATCPDAAAGTIVDAGFLHASCEPDPCGTGQFCGDLLDGEGVVREGLCFVLPPPCMCRRTCACVDAFFGGARDVACTDDGGEVVVTYAQGPVRGSR